MRILWSVPSLYDLQEIIEYIALDNKKAAGRVVAQIKAAVDPLMTNPHLGRVGRLEGTRELILGNLPYIVMYSLSSERVEILRVIHTSRMWPE